MTPPRTSIDIVTFLIYPSVDEIATTYGTFDRNQDTPLVEKRGGGPKTPDMGADVCHLFKQPDIVPLGFFLDFFKFIQTRVTFKRTVPFKREQIPGKKAGTKHKHL